MDFGPIVIAFVIVVLIPVGLLMSGGLASAVLGWFLRDDAEDRHQGSELIDLNR